MTMRVTDLDPNRMDPAGIEEQVRIGDPVEVITRRIIDPGERGVIPYGYAARHPLGWERRV